MDTVNTFLGLNQDTSKAKYKQGDYYDALNVEIVTTTGLSTGAITNTKGTRLVFTIPNISAATYEIGSETGNKVIPPLSNLEILGSTSYDNIVLVFTGKNGYGQIWKLEYNESTGTINGLVGNSLVQATHMIYNRYLNFQNTHRIKAFVRKESSKFIRLYFNDGLNPFRSFNLADPNPLEIKVRTLDIHPLVNHKLPVVQELLNGNLPNCRIGYFYRLISRSGSTTTFSPTSNLIDLNNGNEAGLYEFYPESPIEWKDEKENADEKRRLDFSSEKACKVLIENIDKDYEYIQVGYVQYTIKDQPEMFLLPEEKLNGNSHLFIHSGLEEQVVPLSIAEYSVQNNTFDTFKDFVPKHNELYVANIVNSEYDVDYDARAYRFRAISDIFSSDGLAGVRLSKIYDGSGTLEATIDGVTPIYPTNETLDAINPYNDENPSTNANWLTEDQFRHQANGTILGGTGPNVSYKFITNNHLVDNTSAAIAATLVKGTVISDTDNIAPFNNVNLETNSSVTTGGGQTYPINKSYTDLKSPYKASIYSSYARGEVYRFGLVFVKTNGQKSFVKWIGDIKFPEFGDEYFDGVNTIKFVLDELETSGGSLNHYVKSLGIEFTINNIPSDILAELSHIEIVRVERAEEDRTKLGTGVTGGFVNYSHDPVTVTEFKSFIQGIYKDLLKKVIGGFAGPWGWLPGTDAIYDQLTDQLVDALTYGFNVATTGAQLFENADKDDLSNALTNAIGQVGNGGGAVALLTNAVGKQLSDWIMTKFEGDLKNKKVAEVANSVYSLDNIKYSNSTTATITGIGAAAGQNMAYILSPITQFDKYKYRAGDYIKPLASYEYQTAATYKSPKFTAIYHRDTNVGVFNRAHSTAKFKKWFNPIYFNITTDGARTKRTKLNIEFENTLDVGEILKPNQITNINGVISNSYIGYIERLMDDGSYVLTGLSTKFSVKEKVLGMGDKKHFVKTTTNFPTLIDTVNGVYIVLDQQGNLTNNRDVNNQWYGLIITDLSYTFPIEAAPSLLSTIAVTRPNSVDSAGNFLVSYERYVSEQYGGNTYVARSLNKYINVATIQKSTLSTNNTVTCYKGDTYVGLYDTVNYAYYMEQVPGYDRAVKTKKACGDLFPAEAPFNFNVREGQHFNNAANADDLDFTEKRVKRALRKAKRKSKRSGLDFNEVAQIILPKRFLYDSHIYDDIYDQQDKINLSFPAPIIDIFTDTSSNRIYKSNSKIDGELIDNWKQFKPNNFLDVEGVYGPINGITVLKDRLYFYQSNAIGIATTNERATAATSTGQLALGDSVSLSRYDYLTIETGCSHQFAIVTTDSAIYHFDINTKKLFELSGGLQPISDIQGLGSYFRNNLNLGSINNTDQTLATVPIGIHGIYDNITNRVYFTFLNVIGEERNDFTINYNLLSKSFESFHSFTPGLYFRTNKRLYSVNPQSTKDCYQHKVGNYNSYYGALAPSKITIIINENPQNIKTFDNHLIYTEVTDNNNNLVNETITSIECSNDYQQSGLITLTPGANIRRMERKWHLQIPRDSNAAAYTSLKSRLVDTHLFSTLYYDNPNNRRLVLHDIYTSYRDSIT